VTEIELMKRQVEDQLADYERGIKAYGAFMEDWRERNDPARRRLKRFRAAAQREGNNS
jgi:hypothetical protein